MQTLLVVTWLWILPGGLLAYPTSTAGAANFLNETEELVQTIGKFALQNYLNSADLAETCGTSSNCTRRVCQPLLSDFPLVCEKVPQTFGCEGPNNSTCTKSLVSKKQSYVRWPRDANPENPPCDMISTICSQRELDGQVFIKEGESSDFQLKAWLYFGASNGIDRIYPGKELNDSLCNNFDIRERPWYRGATAVSKEIVVMLDAGRSMGEQLPGLGLMTGPAQTLFDASQNITLRLLDTLYTNDKISVFTFNGSTSSLSVGPMVTVSNSEDMPTLKSLKAAIGALQSPDPNGSQLGNLTATLIAARDQFSNQSSNRLKVVIIITAGHIVGPEDLQPDLVNSLSTSNVTVFTYRLLETNVSGPIDWTLTGNDSVTTKLQNASCSLNGLYEEGQYDVQNPLGTVQSFYSYVAKLRFERNGKIPYWVPKYLAYSGISDIISVAYPVFNDDFFLGVAGVELISNNLGGISSEIEKLLANRNKVRSLDVSDPPRINCSQTALLRDSSCPPALQANSLVKGFCNDTDDNPNKEQMIKARVCCPSCGSSKSPSLSKAGKTGVIIGAVLGGMLSLIVAGLLGWCIYFKLVTKVGSTPEGDEKRLHPLANLQSPIDNPEHPQSVRGERYSYDTLAL